MARGKMSREEAQAHAEAKREKVRALIAGAMDRLTDPATWSAYLAQGGNLGRYSVRNQMLIFMQDAEASDVAGYVEWQDRGRQVRKGETGLLIFAPLTRKAPVDAGGVALKRAAEPGEETVSKVCGLKVTSVFDITQTDAIEGKPFKAAPSSARKSLAEIRAVIVEVAGDAAGPILDAMDRATAGELVPA